MLSWYKIKFMVLAPEKRRLRSDGEEVCSAAYVPVRMTMYPNPSQNSLGIEEGYES